MTQLGYKQRNSKKKRSLLKLTLITFLGVFLIAGGALAYMGYKVANVTADAQQDLDRGERSEFREAEVNPQSEPISVLFLGLDTRDGDLSGRTDAMVLVTFNPEEGSIKMLNIPRDSKVEIIGRYREDKINHAHAFGGIDMTLDTVENLLDIPVDYFVSLNFDAFMEIIDTIDGVEVDVPFTFSEMDSADNNNVLTLQEGNQKLNGEEALAYVRMRKQDPQGDIGRGERQKEVMESVIREVATFGSITKFNSLLNTMGRNIKMNMSFNEIVSMHAYANELDNVESLHFEGSDVRQDGVYYYDIEEQSLLKTKQTLQKHLGIERDTDSFTSSAEDDRESSRFGEE